MKIDYYHPLIFWPFPMILYDVAFIDNNYIVRVQLRFKNYYNLLSMHGIIVVTMQSFQTNINITLHNLLCTHCIYLFTR